MAPHQIIVITGANKGLGLEHVKQFLERTNHRLIATARALEKAADLQKLASSHEGRLHILQLDTTHDESIKVCMQCGSVWLHACCGWMGLAHTPVPVTLRLGLQ